MKIESQKPQQQHVLFLATENVILRVNQPYVIRQDMIESKNFIPEAFLMHQFQDSGESPRLTTAPAGIAGGETASRSLLQLFSNSRNQDSSVNPFQEPIRFMSDEDDDVDDIDEDDDDDWDDEDEDWDDEDEDWEDEDEDFDDDDDADDDTEDDWTEDEE